MANDPNLAPDDPDVAPEEEKSGSPVRTIIVVVLLLAVAGATGLWFRARRQRAAASNKKKPAVETKVNAVMHLESFTVNLADKESSYLRVGIDLGLGRELPGGKEGDQNTRFTPLIRDTFLGVLSTSTSEMLLAPDGRAKLKADLVKALRDRAPELDVREVYFTDFLVQR
ncbi:MAG TPA: flagellar basal body-associated FliL family protein [Terriglobia bacterium]|nr:flagellar basal body-associated FliL family protein [Terriglobia bacterium]